jgi:hypothetical protein
VAERKNNPGSPLPGSPIPVSHIPGSAACGQWETLLPDALDGLLEPADEAIFREHMAVCQDCTALFEESKRGREWLGFLTAEPEVPAGLVDKILAHTGPGHEAAMPLGGPMPVPAGGVPVELLEPKWQKPGFMGFVRRFAEPRLMMTGATAFFSIALTMNMLGVRVTSLRLSDLRPTAMRSFLERQLTMASVPIIRYYDHLRFVYEVESRMRSLRGPAESEEQQNTNPPQNNARPSGGESRKNGGNGGSRVDPPQRSARPLSVTGPVVEASLSQDEGGRQADREGQQVLAKRALARKVESLVEVGWTHSGSSISGRYGRVTRERSKTWIA